MLSETRFHILPRGAPSLATQQGAVAALGQRHAQQCSESPTICKPEASGSQPGSRPAQHPATPTPYQQDLGVYEKNAPCRVPNCPQLSG